MSLTGTARTQLIENVLGKLREDYVFPDVAERIQAVVHRQVEDGFYDGFDSEMEFAQAFTAQLQKIAQDRHLFVIYKKKADGLDLERTGQGEGEGQERERRANFGFEKAARLEGNVGYLELRYHADPEYAGDKLAAVMTFLADMDALILDVRRNGGGNGNMNTLLCSYLYATPQHLGDVVWRRDRGTEQAWTYAHVPGRRYLGKPIYILTSRNTGSAPEALAYGLQADKQATVVGETTCGAANACGLQSLDEQFLLVLPMGYPINPITNTNWGWTGVQPDLEVAADHALETAHRAALERLHVEASDPEQARQLQEALDAVLARSKKTRSKRSR